MAGTIPTQDEVLSYFDKLSNWGRWGDEDELGTLNFLSPAKTKRAVSLVEDGHFLRQDHILGARARCLLNSHPLYGGERRGMGLG